MIITRKATKGGKIMKYEKPEIEVLQFGAREAIVVTLVSAGEGDNPEKWDDAWVQEANNI